MKYLGLIAITGLFALGSCESGSDGNVEEQAEPNETEKITEADIYDYLDPVEVNKEVFRALLDNEYARVLDIQIPMNTAVQMHSHVPGFAFLLTDMMMETTVADGHIGRLQGLKGMSFPMMNEKHAVSNMGVEPIHYITMERKEAELTYPLIELDPTLVSGRYYNILKRDANGRLVELRLPAGARDEMHGHPPTVVYVVSGGSGRLHSPDGSTEDIELRSGACFFNAAVEKHSFENIGDKEIQLLLFELS